MAVNVVPGAAREHVSAPPANQDAASVTEIDRIGSIAAHQDVAQRVPVAGESVDGSARTNDVLNEQEIGSSFSPSDFSSLPAKEKPPQPLPEAVPLAIKRHQTVAQGDMKADFFIRQWSPFDVIPLPARKLCR
jgi:hypothetical protein